MQGFNRSLSDSRGAALIEAVLVFAFVLIVLIGGGFYYLKLFADIDLRANAFDTVALMSASNPPEGIVEMQEGGAMVFSANAPDTLESFAITLREMAGGGDAITACVWIATSAGQDCDGFDGGGADRDGSAGDGVCDFSDVGNLLSSRAQASCQAGTRKFLAYTVLVDGEYIGATGVTALSFAPTARFAAPPTAAQGYGSYQPLTPTPGGPELCEGLEVGLLCGDCCLETVDREQCCTGCCGTGTGSDPTCVPICEGYSPE